MSRSIWWPIGIILLAVAADMSVAANLPAPIRVPAVAGFLLIGPGMAFVRLLRVRPALIELTLAIALSLTLDTLVAEAMVLGRAWSAGLALAVLFVLTVAGATLQMVSASRAERSGPRP